MTEKLERLTAAVADRYRIERRLGEGGRFVHAVAVLAILGVGGCHAGGAPADESAPVDDENTVAPVAASVVEHLRNRDFDALGRRVHPSAGVRFSPYAYVEPDLDLTFSADEIRGAADDSTIHHWGEFDGTGYPIDMTIRQYFDRFVYDVDFAEADEVGEDLDVGSGNTINNVAEIYPGRSITVYHFTGFDPDLEGMDWRTLRLVFRQEQTGWFLEGVIHAEWTT